MNQLNDKYACPIPPLVSFVFLQSARWKKRREQSIRWRNECAPDEKKKRKMAIYLNYHWKLNRFDKAVRIERDTIPHNKKYNNKRINKKKVLKKSAYLTNINLPSDDVPDIKPENASWPAATQWPSDFFIILCTRNRSIDCRLSSYLVYLNLVAMVLIASDITFMHLQNIELNVSENHYNFKSDGKKINIENNKNNKNKKKGLFRLRAL